MLSASVEQLKEFVAKNCNLQPNSTKRGLHTQIRRFGEHNPNFKWPDTMSVAAGDERKVQHPEAREKADPESGDVDITGSKVDVLLPEEMEQVYNLDDSVFIKLPKNPWDFKWDRQTKRRILDEHFPIPGNFDLKPPTTNIEAAKLLPANSALVDGAYKFAQQLASDTLRVALWHYEDCTHRRWKDGAAAEQQMVNDSFILVNTVMHQLALLNDERRKLLDVRRADSTPLVSDQEAKEYVRSRTTAKTARKQSRGPGKPNRRAFPHPTKGRHIGHSKPSGAMPEKPGKNDH